MADGTGEAQSRPSMASPMAFIKSTCSCVDLVVRGVWGCLAYHLGFCEDWADDRSKKEEEHEEDETKTRESEEHEEEETETRKIEEHEEEEDQTGTRKREVHEEEDETKTEANGGTENFGVMLRRGPRRPGIDKGGGGQVN